MNFTTYKVNVLQKIGVQKVPNCSELKSFCFIKTISAATEGQHILLIPQMQCNIWSIWPHSLHQLLLSQQEFSCHDSSQEKKRCHQLYMCWLIARSYRFWYNSKQITVNLHKDVYFQAHLEQILTRGPKSVKNHENGLYRWLSNTKSSNSRRCNLSLHVWPGWRKLIIKLEAHFLLHLYQIEQVTKQGQQETRL